MQKKLTQYTYELELNFDANSQTELVLFADQEGNGLSLTVDTENGKVILDRSKAGEQYATDFGTSRECTLEAGQTATANIFVDNSIVEIFFNKGKKSSQAVSSQLLNKLVSKCHQEMFLDTTSI